MCSHLTNEQTKDAEKAVHLRDELIQLAAVHDALLYFVQIQGMFDTCLYSSFFIFHILKF
jgi:hypothetical protein